MRDSGSRTKEQQPKRSGDGLISGQNRDQAGAGISAARLRALQRAEIARPWSSGHGGEFCGRGEAILG